MHDKFILIKFPIFVIAFLLLLYGCAENRSSDIDSDLIPIRWEDLEERDMFCTDGKLDSCRFVILETSDNCLLGATAKVEITDKYIVILSNKKIFVFDTEGKFLNTIGRIGPGPNEHLTISDFYLDEEAGTIGVYDVWRAEITRYSMDGKMINKTKCDPVLKEACDILGLNEGLLLISMHNNLKNDYHYILVNENDNKLSGNYIPYISRGRANLNIPKYYYATDKTYHYVLAMFSDTIYHFTNREITSKYVLQTPIKKPTKTDIDKYGTFETGMDVMTFLRRDGFSLGIINIYAAGGYIFFAYGMKGDFYQVFWNIAENKGYYNLYQEIENPLCRINQISTTTREAFVSVLDAYTVVESLKTVPDRSLFKELEKVDYQDNPILVFYYIVKK